MRLIEADVLKANVYRSLSDKYADVVSKLIDNAPTVCDIDIEQYAKEHNLFICTTNILEQIKSDIRNQLFVGRIVNSKDFDDGLKFCLEIMDEYTKGE